MRRESGQAVIFVALLIVVVFGFAALAIDLGSEFAHGVNVQKAADAAALDGATIAPGDGWDASTITTQVESFLDTYYGIPATEVKAVTPDQTDQTVKVTLSEPNLFHFAPVLGTSEATLTKSATAKLGLGRSPFDYAVFSDQPITWTDSFLVTGAIHTNGSFEVSVGSSPLSYATGGIEAIGSITVNKQAPYQCWSDWVNLSETGTLNDNAPAVEMPDLSNEIQSLENQAKNDTPSQYVDPTNWSSVLLPQTGYAWSYKNGTGTGTGTFTLSSGAGTPTGPYVLPPGPWYFDGNVDLDTGGDGVDAQGAILASGTIEVQGPNLNADSTSNVVAFYSASSANPAIFLTLNDNAANSTINGTFYAPNGTIKLGGGIPTINGSVIGYGVDISNPTTVNYTNNTILSSGAYIAYLTN